MKKNEMSTFDKAMADPERKKRYEEGYNDFLLQEKFLEAMEVQHLSVRKLADLAKVSKTTIQTLRTGRPEQITLGKLRKIVKALNMDFEINLHELPHS